MQDDWRPGVARRLLEAEDRGALGGRYADVVEGLGSQDGREVALGLDALRQAGKLGRDPQSVKISSLIIQAVVTDSSAATRIKAEQIAGSLGISTEQVLSSAMFLIGTPDECVEQLRYRNKE